MRLAGGISRREKRRIWRKGWRRRLSLSFPARRLIYSGFYRERGRNEKTASLLEGEAVAREGFAPEVRDTSPETPLERQLREAPKRVRLSELPFVVGGEPPVVEDGEPVRGRAQQARNWSSNVDEHRGRRLMNRRPRRLPEMLLIRASLYEERPEPPGFISPRECECEENQRGGAAPPISLLSTERTAEGRRWRSAALSRPSIRSLSEPDYSPMSVDAVETHLPRQ